MMTLLRAVFFFVCVFAPVAEASDVDERWLQAVTWIESGRHWIPGRVDTHIRETNKAGTQLSLEFLQVVHEREGKNGVRRRLIRASKDGQDVTASRKEKVDEVHTKADAISKRAEQDVQRNPFSFVAQEGMTVTDLNEQKEMDGHLCRKWGFVRKSKRKEIFKGWVWIDVETSKPFQAQIELLDTPWPVKRLVSNVHYGTVGDGGWGAVSVKMSGYGGMLGINRYMETSMKMSTHWLLE